MSDKTDVLKTDIAIGTEGDLGLSATGDLASAGGLQNLRQAVTRRLLCARGELIWAASYGGGLVTQLERSNSPAQRLLMAQLARANCLQDSRVKAVTVAVTSEARRPQQVTVSVKVTAQTDETTKNSFTLETP